MVPHLKDRIAPELVPVFVAEELDLLADGGLGNRELLVDLANDSLGEILVLGVLASAWRPELAFVGFIIRVGDLHEILALLRGQKDNRAEPCQFKEGRLFPMRSLDHSGCSFVTSYMTP